MKLFVCQSCQALLFFENESCETCGHRLGYLPLEATLSAVEPAGDGSDALVALARPGRRFRPCANAAHHACNWLISDATPSRWCIACRHNRTIPDIADPTLLLLWQRLEAAKHRLFYSLLRLGLPLATRARRPDGLAYDFLDETEQQRTSGARVMTGHDEGLITLRVREADDAERERMRHQMGEPYRTLLGHFRHEVGHYFWDRLVRDGGRLEACREVFGDDRQDYQAALKRHYAEAPSGDWRQHSISDYAATHPWEDFAETWAHYLHIVDTLETAASLGLSLQPVDAEGRSAAGLAATLDFDPYEAPDIETIIRAWMPLTVAMNNLNRSMGQPDLYPFVLSAPVIRKLGFIHTLLRESRAAGLAGERG